MPSNRSLLETELGKNVDSVSRSGWKRRATLLTCIGLSLPAALKAGEAAALAREGLAFAADVVGVIPRRDKQASVPLIKPPDQTREVVDTRPRIDSVTLVPVQYSRIPLLFENCVFRVYCAVPENGRARVHASIARIGAASQDVSRVWSGNLQVNSEGSFVQGTVLELLERAGWIDSFGAFKIRFDLEVDGVIYAEDWLSFNRGLVVPSAFGDQAWTIGNEALRRNAIVKSQKDTIAFESIEHFDGYLDAKIPVHGFRPDCNLIVAGSLSLRSHVDVEAAIEIALLFKGKYPVSAVFRDGLTTPVSLKVKHETTRESDKITARPSLYRVPNDGRIVSFELRVLSSAPSGPHMAVHLDGVLVATRPLPVTSSPGTVVELIVRNWRGGRVALRDLVIFEEPVLDPHFDG